MPDELLDIILYTVPLDTYGGGGPSDDSVLLNGSTYDGDFALLDGSTYDGDVALLDN